jgi:anti-anti-sigma factor
VTRPRLELTTEERKGILIACVKGEIDLDGARTLGEELRVRATRRGLHLIVDLTEVGFIDSQGVRLFLELKRDLDRRRQRLRLVVPPGSVLTQVLAVAKLDKAVGIDASLAAAQAALDARPDR